MVHEIGQRIVIVVLYPVCLDTLCGPRLLLLWMLSLICQYASAQHLGFIFPKRCSHLWWDFHGWGNNLWLPPQHSIQSMLNPVPKSLICGCYWLYCTSNSRILLFLSDTSTCPAVITNLLNNYLPSFWNLGSSFSCFSIHSINSLGVLSAWTSHSYIA